MNPRTAARLQRSVEILLLLLAAGLPLTVDRHLYYAAYFKDLSLQAISAALLGLTLWRFLETGRVETPANRTALAAAALAWLTWMGLSFALNPLRRASLSSALLPSCSVVVFLLTLTDAASLSFAAALADWSLAAAAATYALQESPLLPLGIQPFSTLGHPDLLGAFYGAVFPLGLSRALDPESPPWRRGGALLAALLCPLGVLASGSFAGLMTLCLGSSVFAALALRSRVPRHRAAGLAAAASVAGFLEAASRIRVAGESLGRKALASWGYGFQTAQAALRLFREHPLRGAGTGAFVPSAYPWISDPKTPLEYLSAYSPSLPLRAAAESGLIGLILAGAVLGCALAWSLKDIVRRLDRDDARSGILLSGLWACAAGLLAADLLFPVLSFPAPGILLWLAAGCLAGMAKEEGSSKVWVLPIPLAPGVRRKTAAALAPVLLGALCVPTTLFLSDAAFNFGVFERARGTAHTEAAVAGLSKVSSWHPYAWVARRLAANSRLEAAKGDAVDGALALYREEKALFPRGGADCEIAYAQKKAGRWAEAADSYALCLRGRPDIASAYAELADVSAILGRKDDVLAAARGWIRAEPRNPDAWHFLADQYRDAKKFRLARRMLDKAGRVSDVASAAAASPLY